MQPYRLPPDHPYQGLKDDDIYFQTSCKNLASLEYYTLTMAHNLNLNS